MWLINLLRGLPPEFVLVIIAATPVIEVRGSVPLGLLYFNFPASKVIFLSTLGSILPALPLFWFLHTMTDKLRKIRTFDKFFSWLFERTRSRSKIIEDMEIIGLMLFVAIPLPGTGVWTGIVAAYLLGLRWLPSLIAVSLGTAIASFLVALGSGAIKLLF